MIQAELSFTESKQETKIPVREKLVLIMEASKVKFSLEEFRSELITQFNTKAYHNAICMRLHELTSEYINGLANKYYDPRVKSQYQAGRLYKEWWIEEGNATM